MIDALVRLIPIGRRWQDNGASPANYWFKSMVLYYFVDSFQNIIG
jgi:hypothetical protein